MKKLLGVLFFILTFFLYTSTGFASQPCHGQAGQLHTNPDDSLGGFVASTASVENTVFLSEQVSVCDRAVVKGDTQIFDQVKISGRARIAGNVILRHQAQIFGSAVLNWRDESQSLEISDQSQIYGQARVYGAASISGQAQILGRAEISGQAKIFEDAIIRGSAKVSGEAQIFGRFSAVNGHFTGSARACDDFEFNQFTTITEGLAFCKHQRYPVAQISLDANSGVAPFTVNAESFAHIASDDTIVFEHWSSGIPGLGEEINQNNYSFTYQQAGTYYLSYRVVNAQGNEDSRLVPITVLTPLEKSPHAIISISGPKESQQIPFELDLNAYDSYSYQEQEEIYAYYWHFSDGHTYVGPRVQRTLTERGIYEVTLTVQDSLGVQGHSKIKIAVGCVHQNGDNLCLSLTDVENQLLTTDSPTWSKVANGSQTLWDINQSTLKAYLLRDDFSSTPIEITDHFELVENELLLNVEMLKQKMIALDFVDDFLQIQIEARSPEGVLLRGVLRKVQLAQSSISGTLGRPNIEVKLVSLDHKLELSSYTDGQGGFSFNNLPADVYALWGNEGVEFFYDIFILDGNSQAIRNPEFRDQFSNENGLINHKEVYDAVSVTSPSEKGVKTKEFTQLHSVLSGYSSARFKTFFIHERSEDAFFTLVTYVDDKGQLRWKVELEKVATYTPHLLKKGIPHRSESEWRYYDLSFTDTVQTTNFFVSLNSINRGKTSNRGLAQSALAFSFETDVLKKPIITRVERVDNNPKTKFIPASIDSDQSELSKNPFAKRPKDWKLSWRVYYELPLDHAIFANPLKLFLSQDHKKDSIELETFDWEQKNDVNGDYFLVTFDLNEFDQIDFLKNWSLDSPEMVFFGLQIESSEFLGTPKTSSEIYEVPFEVLYDGKQLNCPLAARPTSLYLNKSGMQRLSTMLESTDELSYFSCLAASDPYGEGLTEFETFTLSYFGPATLSSLNRNPGLRLLALEKIWSLLKFTFEQPAIEQREQEISLLSYWVATQRKSISYLFDFFNVRKVQGVTLSTGRSFTPSSFDNTSWNLDLILRGIIPSREVNEAPLALRNFSDEAQALGSCVHFPHPETTVDESCQLNPENLILLDDEHDQLTFIFERK